MGSFVGSAPWRAPDSRHCPPRCVHVARATAHTPQRLGGADAAAGKRGSRLLGFLAARASQHRPRGVRPISSSAPLRLAYIQATRHQISHPATFLVASGKHRQQPRRVSREMGAHITKLGLLGPGPGPLHRNARGSAEWSFRRSIRCPLSGDTTPQPAIY